MQSLFKDAPDLLSEFKKFLPIDGGAPFGAEPFGDPSWPEMEVKKIPKPDVAPPPAKRRKRPEKEIQPTPASVAPPPKTGASRVSAFVLRSLYSF